MHKMRHRRLFDMAKQFAMFFFATCFISAVDANPVLNNIAAGNVTVQQSPNVTQVNQSSQSAIINWNSFNIGANEATHFQQPTNGIALNRINPQQGASQIFGQLTATGQIILVNQAGIFFGSSAQVNVGGIIASTTDITDQNFLAGNYIFDQPSTYTDPSIVNEGSIIAAQHGLVALVGSTVRNDGMIQAQMGNIVLASGNEFTVSFANDSLVNFAVTAPATNGSVTNTGTLTANGGKILMTAREAQDVLDNVINMQGVAQANSVDEQNGEIILDGGDTGFVNVEGVLEASGLGIGQTGGTIKILGENILLQAPTTVNVSGNVGGGEILVGGNFHGGGPEQDALTTNVASGSFLLADAISNGNGGQVAVWSNNDTQFHGTISAQGGALGGNGGYVETSGGYLDVSGASINTSARAGQTGTWLLDPYDIYICDANSSPSCTSSSNIVTTTSGGTTTKTDDQTQTISYLWEQDLANALNSNNVIVTNANSVNNAIPNGFIIVLAPIPSVSNGTDVGWTSSNTLTLSAYEDIIVQSTIANTNGGKLILRANNSGGWSTYYSNFTTTQNGTVDISGGTISVSGGLTVYTNPTNGYGSVPTYTNTAGSSTTYLLVSNVYDLQEISVNPSASYVLAYNIDASPTKSASFNSNQGFVPISGFSGSLDGQNFGIYNLWINKATIGGTEASNIGLFASISPGAQIQNLSLNNFNITGDVNVGTLAGEMLGGTINNVTASGAVTAGQNGGGLIGLISASSGNNISVTNSTTNVAVVGDVNYDIVTGQAGTILGGVIGSAASTDALTSITLNNLASHGPVSSLENQVSAYTTSLGGLVGSLSATNSNTVLLENSYSNSPVTAGMGDAVGGLVGLVSNASIQNSYSTGSVTAADGNLGGVGGLVGQLTNGGTILDSYSNASVQGILDVGGLVGLVDSTNSNSISNSYSEGSVNGDSYSYITDYVGGLIGAIGGGSVTDSYSGASVSAGNSITTYAGGFIGAVNGTGNVTISTSYSAGAVTGLDTANLYGFLAAVTNSSISMPVNNYWDKGTSGQTTGVTASAPVNVQNSVFGLTTAAAMNSGNYSGSGWTFGTTPNSANWYIVNGYTRPILQSEYSTTISSAHQLQLMNLDTTASYQLATNVDASGTSNASDVWATSNSHGTGFYSIGLGSSFTGSLNGNGYVINNLYMAPDGAHTSYGLFSTLDSGATVSDVGIVNGTLNFTAGATSNLGLLTGTNNAGTIITSFATGTISDTASGTANVGGLIGIDSSGNTTSDSYASVNITNTNTSGNTGGFIGDLSSGAITDSYSTGSVSAAAGFAGGFAGNNSGSLTRVYSSGLVTNTGSATVGGLLGNESGTTTNSFWDQTTSNQLTSADGTGESLASMTSLATFNSTWDISASSGHVWYILDGFTRPILQSEYSTSINTTHQLQLMNLNKTAAYTMTGNIDASNTAATNTTDVWAGNTFSPVGSDASPFIGSLNGQFYTINNLNISSSNTEVGLFGATVTRQHVVSYNGLRQNINAVYAFSFVNDLIVKNALVKSTDTGNNEDVIGIVAGEVNAPSNSMVTLENVSTLGGSVTVTNNNAYYNIIGGVAGLPGYTNDGGLIVNVSNNAKVDASSITSNRASPEVGGVAGEADTSILINTSNSGTIIGGESSYGVGGLLGIMYQDTIQASYNIGTIIGPENSYMGGLVGENYCCSNTITQSYNAGLVENTQAGINSYFGGLDGYSNGGLTISESYNLGNVLAAGNGSNGNIAGGIIGHGNGTLNDVYDVGYVTADYASDPIIAEGSMSGSHRYFDSGTTGVASTGDGTNLSNLDMTNPANFTGFNFNTTSPRIWNISTFETFPFLYATNPGGVPQVISGFMPVAAGTSNAVAVALNGSPLSNSTSGTYQTIQSSTQTGWDGFFYFQENPTAIPYSSPFLVYLTSTSDPYDNTTIASTAAANIISIASQPHTGLNGLDGTTGFNVTSANSVFVSNAAGISTADNATLSIAAGNLETTDLSDILFSTTTPVVTGSLLDSDITLGNATSTTANLVTPSGTTFLVTGNILATPADNVGSQFNGALTLTKSVTIEGAGSGVVDFENAVDGAYALSVQDPAGGVIINGTIGGNTPLTSLTIGDSSDSSPQATTLGTASITTAGDQKYYDPIAGASGDISTLTSNSGNILFNSTIDTNSSASAAWTLAAIAHGTMTFNGDIGTNSGSFYPIIDPSTSASSFIFGDSNVDVTSATFGAPVTLNSASVNFVPQSSGGITFSAGIDGTTSGANSVRFGGTNPVTVATDFGGNVPFDSITDIAPLTLNLSGNQTITTPGSQTWGIVTFGGSIGNVAFTSTGSSLELDSQITLNGANTLTLTANNNIYFNTDGAISVPSGSLIMNTPNNNYNPTIGGGTIGSGTPVALDGVNDITVANFELVQGFFDAITAAYPVITVTNNFKIDSGTTYNGAFNAEFALLAPTGGRGGFSYVVPNVFALQGIATLQGTVNLASNFLLNSNIDASSTINWNNGAGFIPIATDPGVASFSGTFNGQGSTINGLYINLPSSANNVGFIGTLNTPGTLTNVTLSNVNITGKNNVGGAVGEFTGGTVDTVTVSGTVNGQNNVGGLVGIATDTSGFAVNMSNSIAEVVVNGLTANQDSIGGAIGLLDVSQTASTINNVISHGYVVSLSPTSAPAVGGLIGATIQGSSGSIVIENSQSDAAVIAPYGSGVGGLTGSANGNITIQNSYFTGSVTGSVDSNFVGGLVGNLLGSTTILNSYSNATIQGGSDVGGLVGKVNSSSASITQSYTEGSVSGANNVGGLIGYINGGTVENSYCGASVTVSSGAAGSAVSAGPGGGLIGYVDSGSSVLISTNYSAGAVTGSSGAAVGGFMGGYNPTANITLSQNYWDTGTSGQAADNDPDNSNVNGITTANALQQGSYGSNWTFGTTPSSGNWYMINGYTRPILQSEYSTTITSAHQLQLINLAPTASYQLTNNVDASGTANAGDVWATSVGNGTGFDPIARGSAFTGSLNGNGHVISNVYMAPTDATHTSYGLISVLGSGGSVTQVGIVNGTLTTNVGVAANLGLLVGSNTGGNIHNDFATGNISYTASAGATNVGGLIGIDSSGNSITQSYSSVNITNDSTDPGSYTGGFIGNLDTSIIQYAYSTGSITVANGYTGYVGGFAGYNNQGQISFVYSSGAVPASGAVGGLIGLENQTVNGTTLNSFWDEGTSGTTTGIASGGSLADDVNGESTANMQLAATFSGDSWSISSNPGFTWFNLDGQTRPILQSEYSTNINTAHQLQLMDLHLNSTYAMTGNIDASNTASSNTTDVWAGNTFSPVGSFATPFTGIFNGQFYAINNLNITSLATEVGLFGSSGNGTNSTGYIANLTLKNPTIFSENTTGGFIRFPYVVVGAVAGSVQSFNNYEVTVDNVSVIGGYVESSFNNARGLNFNTTGGVIGYIGFNGNVTGEFGGLVENVSNSAVVPAPSLTGVSQGGIAGEADNATLINLSNSAAIDGSIDAEAGGLIGFLFQSTLSSSYNVGSIESLGGGFFGSAVGGLVGGATGSTISQSYNGGSIWGTPGSQFSSYGGLVGEFFGGDTITDSYNLASVVASGSGNTVGGLVGSANNSNTPGSSAISTSYSTGYVLGDTGTTGQLLGQNSTIVTDTHNFYDTDTTDPNQSGVTFGTGLTNSQMMNFSNFTGFSNSIWAISTGETYPYLKALNPGGAPQVISGTMPVGADNAVAIALNGNPLTASATPYSLTTLGTTQTGFNGFFYLQENPTVIPANDVFITYLTTTLSPSGSINNPPAAVANIVSSAALPGSGLGVDGTTGLTGSANTIVVSDAARNGNLSNGTLGQAIGTLGNTDLSDFLFSAGTNFSGNFLHIGNTTNVTPNFVTTTGTSYEIDGDIHTNFGTSSSLTFNGPVQTSNAPSGIEIFSSDNQTFNDTLAVSTVLDLSLSGRDLTFNGAISGSGSLEIGAAGATFNAANSYTGFTEILAGTNVTLNAVGALPDTDLLMDGTLDMNGQSMQFTALSGSGAISNSSATQTTLTIAGNNPNNSYTGTLSGNLNLVMNGGSFDLEGTNSYTGTTSLINTFLGVGNSSSLSTSTVNVDSASTLEVGGINLSNPINLSGTLEGFATASTSGTITLLHDAIITNASRGRNVFTINSDIIGASHNLQLTGTATTIQLAGNISGINNLTSNLTSTTIITRNGPVTIPSTLDLNGTSISAGTLTFNTPIAVSSSGTYSFNTTAGDITFNANVSGNSTGLVMNPSAGNVVHVAQGVNLSNSSGITMNSALVLDGNSGTTSELISNGAITLKGVTSTNGANLTLTDTTGNGATNFILGNSAITMNGGTFLVTAASGQTNDTLTAPNASPQTWTVNGNSGNLGSIPFNNMQNLIGSDHGDTFNFGTAGTVSVDGGTIGATINTTTAGNVTLTGAGTNSGLAGTSNLGPGSFTNINTFNSGNNASVTGISGGNDTWSISGANTFTVTASSKSANFTGFPVINGGASGGSDTFNFTSSNFGGTINGGGNSSTFNFTLGAIGATIVGGSGTNTFNFAANQAFSDTGSITGGSGNNSFIFGDNSSFNGTLNGGSSSSSTLNLAAYSTPITINFSNGNNGIIVNNANATIVSFNNFNSATGNEAGGSGFEGTIQFPTSATANIVSLSLGPTNEGVIGAFSDPFAFIGFNTLIGQSSGIDQFNLSGFNLSGSGQIINGIPFFYSGFNFSEPAPTPTPTPAPAEDTAPTMFNAQIISAVYPVSTSASSGSSSGSGGSSSGTITYSSSGEAIYTDPVTTNITTIQNQQVQLDASNQPTYSLGCQ